MGFEEVALDHNWLQRVTGSYKGLQGVTNGYMGL